MHKSTVTIYRDDEPIEVEVIITGKHRRATLEEPEEFPDVEFVADVELTDEEKRGIHWPYIHFI